MNFPNGTTAHTVPNEIDSPAAMMMYYYMAQIHLRKALNRVHTDLYKAESKYFYFMQLGFLFYLKCSSISRAKLWEACNVDNLSPGSAESQS